MKPQMDNGHLPQRGGTPLRVCPEPFGHGLRPNGHATRWRSLRFALTPVACGGKPSCSTGLTSCSTAVSYGGKPSSELLAGSPWRVSTHVIFDTSTLTEPYCLIASYLPKHRVPNNTDACTKDSSTRTVEHPLRLVL